MDQVNEDHDDDGGLGDDQVPQRLEKEEREKQRTQGKGIFDRSFLFW